MKTYFFHLQQHHISYLLPVIEARIEVLKRRMLKKYADDWYDYGDDQLDFKFSQHSAEYTRLKQVISTILKEQ